MLQLPILIAVVLLAVVLRVEGEQATVVYVVCAGAAALDVVLARYLLRNGRARLVITRDDITYTNGRASNGKAAAPEQVIHRVDGSTLSFRVAANGPVGSK